MIKNLNPRRRILASFSTLLMFAAYFQAMPIQLAAQSLITRLATIRTSNVKASFRYTPSFPAEGQAVQFADISTGTPTSWQWDFGDGATSTAQNPSHAYLKAGFKKITLIASNSISSKKTTRTMTVMPAPETASFVYSPTSPAPGQDVQFADTTSENPTSWQWNFGDGATSTAKNPRHAYATSAAYLVTLIASNDSSSKKGTQTISVASVSSLVASFAYSPTSPAAGQAMQFTDTSTGSPTSWQWNFGDGTMSSAQNPSHTYTTAGSKTVTLTTTNSSGSNTATRTVTVVTAFSASFSYSPASPTAGQAVQFTDTSTGSPASWQWNFGDGTTSTAQNPSHAFATAGSKTVTLTVTNSSGSNTATRTVPVVAALTAAFSYSPTSPTAGQAVQFTDTSIGTPTLWQWNFGDGATSIVQNPSHTFATAGSYTITLTVMTASGQDTTSQTITIAQASPLTASITYNPASPAAGQGVQFTDTSTGNPTSWNWNFNDGSTSTTRNPSHTFTAAGSYSVTLVASNGSGSSTSTRIVNVAPASTPVASFTYGPTSPAVGQGVQFTDTSTGNPTSWQWDFGDGSTSTTQNPSHIFLAAASYNVILSVANSSGSNSRNQVISVSPTSNNVHYAASPSSAHIQAAIDAASDGDTVLVPAGSATWTSNVTVPSTKGVMVIGAGTNINLSNTYYIFLDTRSTNSRVRLSGFNFTNCPESSLRINYRTTGATDWRIDHCSWTDGAFGAQISITGYTFGVIDNCTFTNCRVSIFIDHQTRPLDTTGSPMPYPGGYSWQQPLDMGGPSAVYIEDCTIHNDVSSIFFDCRAGARFVFRHNTVTGINGLETHSGCTPGYRNPRWMEIYENTFDLQGGSYWCGLFLRATNGVVFNNTLSSGYQIGIRFDNETLCRTDCISCWPTANTTVYPAQDQIGAGMDTGWATPQATNEAKLWIWNNRLNGSPTTPVFASCAKSAELIQLGRDYFHAAPSSYAPYTYPHPLRND